MSSPALKGWDIVKNKGHYWLLFLILLFSSVIIFASKPFGSNQTAPHTQKVQQASIHESIQALQTALYKHPDNVQLATQLARYYLQQSKMQGTDRALYLLLAQETLQIWWDQKHPPVEVLSLRAYLYQAQHEFSLAHADLTALLAQQPNHPNAAFSLAMLQQIQGDYKKALYNCKSLLKTRRFMLSGLCQASVQSVNGQAQRAYKVLKVFLMQMATEDQWRQWTLTLLADIANRLGDIQAAEQYFQQALAIPTQDAYLQLRYADFLLTQQRAQDLLEQFSDIAADKQLLLRQHYAAQLLPKRMNKDDYAMQVKRYVAVQQQNINNSEVDKQHAALWAYYYLHIDQQPQKALRFANLNWKQQKSNQDLHLLLHAALLTQDDKTLSIVKNWRKKTALEDITLDHLLAKHNKT